MFVFILEKILPLNNLYMNKILLITSVFLSTLMIVNGINVDGISGATEWKKETKGNVNGKIIDEKTSENLEYTNVSIYSVYEKKIIEGTITDNKGRFSFEDLLIGKYKLSISFIGYETKEINFETSIKNPNYQFKRIVISPSTLNISEIEINETNAVYENKIDKIVYNPENDINQSSDDATDVLRKAPLLSVDLDGNVSLRGSRNIKFLVNGKSSTFFSSDAATALQMIPADEIKSVEVITSPGAKYDGEGDAGIVNIITKKKIIDGYKGTLTGSLGTRVNRQNLNLTLGKNKFGISLKGGVYGMYWPRTGTTKYRRIDWESIVGIDTINSNILSRNGESFSRWTGYRSGMNIFYDLNALTSVTSSFSFGGRDKFSDDTTQLVYSGDTNYNYQSIINTKSISNNFEWSSDFTKKFSDNPNRELSISLQLSADFDEESTNVVENNTNTYNSSNGIGTEKTFQLDYIHPFGESKSQINVKEKLKESYRGRGSKKGSKKSISEENKIELGIKFIDRENNFDYYTEINQDYTVEPELFNYDQRVFSSYLSSQFKLPKNIGLVFGGRYEMTNINGNWDTDRSIEEFSNSYGNFLPNLVLNKKISMTKSLKFSFNKRISRPSSYYINPNIGRTDNKNITIGNPELKPAISDQIEFGYTSFSRMYQGSYYIYMKKTSDVIEGNISVNGDTSITSYLNIGQNNKLGFNYYGSIMFKGVNLRGGFNIFKYSSEDDQFGTIEAILYNYNIGGTINLGNKIRFETWGWFSSPTQTLQGSTDNFSMMTFGIKKDFKNKRGSLGIRLVEPFKKYKDFTTQLSGGNFTQYSVRQMKIRSVGISFSYTFGKLNFKEKIMNSKIKNNDLIDGGNSDQ